MTLKMTHFKNSSGNLGKKKTLDVFLSVDLTETGVYFCLCNQIKPEKYMECLHGEPAQDMENVI